MPAPLKAGDRIAIASPASKIDPALIDAAASALTAEGFEVVVMPHAKGVNGSFSGSVAERLDDMRTLFRQVACGVQRHYGSACPLGTERGGVDARGDGEIYRTSRRFRVL